MRFLFSPGGADEKTLRSDEAQTARAGLVGTIAGLVSFLSGILLMPVLSRLLPAEALGRAVTYTSVREIIFWIISLSIAHSVPIAMIDFCKNKYGYISSIFLFAGGCTAVLFLILLTVKRHILFLFFGSSFLFYWFFLMLLLQLSMEIITFYANFHNKYIVSFFIIVTTNMLAMLVSIFLIANTGIEKYVSRIIGMDSFILVIGLAGAAVILLKGKLHFNLEHIKYGYKITAPLAPYTISTIVLMRSDILVMAYFGTEGGAGIYTMAFTIANILFVVLQQLGKSWSPWVYRKMSLGELGAVHAVSKHFVLFAFLAGVGLMAVTPELLRFFISIEYYDSVLLICPLVAAMFFRFLNLLFYDVEYFNKKNLFNGISHAAAAVLNIALDIILIDKFGFAMCAVTTALCFGGLALVHYIYAKRIDGRRIFNDTCICLCCAAMIAFCFLISFTLDFWILRYGALLAAAAAVCFSERAFIRDFTKKFRKN